jgi:hypothetical protein
MMIAIFCRFYNLKQNICIINRLGSLTDEVVGLNAIN